MSFSRKDFIFSVITGLYAGVIIWRILSFLEAPTFGLPHPHSYFIIIVPVLWILGVKLGYFLGQRMPFFNQFGKYAAIGFTNAAVYFGFLNLLIAGTDIVRGFYYSLFVAVAFFVGTAHSFFWNKYWSFEASQSGGGGREFGKFFIVSIIAGLINVGIASLVVNGLEPMFGLSGETWANIGGIAGSAVALIFSFVGFRLLVFKQSVQADKHSSTQVQ